MKRRPFLHSIILAAAASHGCAGTGSSSTSDVVSSLTSQLGVTPQQATGGVGSMLSYAKSQLSPSDFGTVASALPGADSYMKLASAALGGGAIDTPAALGSAFSRLGMSPDMVNKFAPVVADYAGKYGSAAAKNVLTGLFK
jgi:hypothetical protein